MNNMMNLIQLVNDITDKPVLPFYLLFDIIPRHVLVLINSSQQLVCITIDSYWSLLGKQTIPHLDWCKLGNTDYYVKLGGCLVYVGNNSLVEDLIKYEQLL